MADPRTQLAGTARDAGTSFNPQRKTVDWSGAITATTLWAPATGARVVITDYIVSITTASKCTVFAETNNTTQRCFQIDGTDKGGAAMPHLRSPIRTTGGETVKVTTDGGAGTVTVYGYEEPDT